MSKYDEAHRAVVRELWERRVNEVKAELHRLLHDNSVEWCCGNCSGKGIYNEECSCGEGQC